jgi:lipopolysaccharide exporter
MAEAAAPKGGNSMLGGVAWMLGFRLFDRIAGIISILILARLLKPEHFGIVALASSVVAFVELLAALGLDTVLIQKRELTRDHYDTAWTIQVGVAALCATLLALAAIPASAFFHEPRLQGIVYLLALSMFIEGWQNIRLVDFRREMRFDREFFFMAGRRSVAVLVTMAAAFAFRNQWALAIGIISSRTVGVVLSYAMRPYRPRFSLAHRGEFVGKSSWLLASNLVMFVRNRTSDLVLGRTSGAATVGTYNLAADLANMVGQEMIAPINRVALPDFSQKGTKAEIGERFDVLTGQVAVFIAPMGAGMAACAGVLVPVLFGPAWMAAVPVLRYLAWAALVSALASNIGVAFLSLGHYRANAAIHAIGAVIIVPLLIVGAELNGAAGAAAAVLVGNIAVTAAALVFSVTAFDYGPLRFLARIWRPLLAAGFMYAVVFLTGGWVTDWLRGVPEILDLFIMVAVGAVVYPPALLGLWFLCGRPDGAERLTMRLVRQLLARRKAAATG